jgi:hypothetical protein
MKPQMPLSVAWCVAEQLLASGSEHYRVHRAAHVIANELNWLTFVASRFSPADKDTPWLIEIEGQALCPNVVILRPSVLTEVRYSDDYADLDPAGMWDQMRESVAHAQRHGQIVLLDLDDHPYAWNAFFPDKALSEETWAAHDRYIAQFNAVLCSTQYLVGVMWARFSPPPPFLNENHFVYAPNLYDPWRYHPEKAQFGKKLGSHIFVKARDQSDFDALHAIRPVMDADRELEFVHIGEEFACASCSHPDQHHYDGFECDDCACEGYVAGPNNSLASAAGLTACQVITYPACNPSELPDVIPTFNVGIVPLADSEWNYAKTEGKGFEMAAAGIPFVALTGDHPLYKKTPGCWYSLKSNMSAIQSLASDESHWAKRSSEARKWAERIAQEHQIEYVATMLRLSKTDLSK